MADSVKIALVRHPLQRALSDYYFNINHFDWVTSFLTEAFHEKRIGTLEQSTPKCFEPDQYVEAVVDSDFRSLFKETKQLVYGLRKSKSQLMTNGMQFKFNCLSIFFMRNRMHKEITLHFSEEPAWNCSPDSF